jgi:hypothetical protein
MPKIKFIESLEYYCQMIKISVAFFICKNEAGFSLFSTCFHDGFYGVNHNF